MIIDKFKVLMVHIPRCAGTSLETHYNDIRGHHDSWFEYEKAFPKEWKEYFKFAVCRHPYSYVVSLYNYWMNMSQARWFGELDTHTERKQAGEDLFRKHVGSFENTIKYLEHLMKVGWTGHHFRLQSSFIFDGDKSTIDYLVKIEDFVDDMTLVQMEIGAPVSEIPNLNAVGDDIRVEDLTQAQKDRIYEVYEEDFRLLGYER